MGSVWSATDESQAGPPVALKVLHRTAELRPDSRKRLRREAKASTLIEHPAIVPVQEMLELDGFLVLVMDLLHGETLRKRLDREGQLDARDAALLLLQVASALRAAHSAGVLHRDLKPENIFLVEGARSGAEVRILDFGVAKFLEPISGPGSQLHTAFGTLLGTLAYMAPEQVTGVLDVDERADTWGLGVVLYEALVGFRPIEGSTRDEIIRRLLTDAIVPISALAPEVPGELARLVGRMLSRSPNGRPGDEEVERVLGSFSVARP
jgi:serine/threonine-protein kinase